MILIATGLMMLAVGLASKTPEVSNHNTEYCVAAPTRTNPKQERSVEIDVEVIDSRCPVDAQCIIKGELTTIKNCTKGTTSTEAVKPSLSERKAK